MIERVTVDGRRGSAMFVDSKFMPVDEKRASFLKIVFDDGGQLILGSEPQPEPRSLKQIKWKFAKAEAERLLRKDFDPNQPRDDGGKWVGSGGGADSSGPADKPAQMSMAPVPPPPPAARAQGLNTVAYHATNQEFEEFKPSGYRGVTFFGPTPQGALKGAAAGKREMLGDQPPSPEAVPINLVVGVYLRSQDIEGLSLSPAEKSWWKALPDRTDGDGMEAALQDRPVNINYWFEVYDEVQKGDDFEYIKKEIPEITYEQAQKTGKDVYGKMIPGFGEGGESGDRATAKRVQAKGMSGWIVSDEAGVSIAHINPADKEKLRLASDFASEKDKKRLKAWRAAKAQAEALLARGDFIQDPETGKLQGSHPGGGKEGDDAKPSPEKLSPKQLDMFRKYRYPGEAGKKAYEAIRVSDEFDAALDMLQRTKNATVYRGMNLSSVDFGKLKVGVFTMAKASSAATVKAHATGFAFGKNVAVLMQIDGADAAVFGPYSGFKSEVVFNKGSRIEITAIKDATLNGIKIKQVTAKYVGRTR